MTSRVKVIDQLALGGQYEEARRVALEWTHEQPTNAQAWSKLSYALRMKGEHDKADAALAQAATNDTGDYNALFSLARRFHAKGLHAQAAQAFAQCAKVCERSGELTIADSARVGEAECWKLDGQPQKAREALGQLHDWQNAATWVDRMVKAPALSQLLQESPLH